MKSIATLLNLATSLTQNTSAANQNLMLQLISDDQRYKLQKYFDNERTYQNTTLGGLSNLPITAQLLPGATSATLSQAWGFQSCTQFTEFAAPTTAVTLTTTASMASGDTSATLSVSWSGNTGVYNVTFSNGQVLAVLFTASSTAITFQGSLTSSATSTITMPSATDQRSVTFTNGSTALTWTGGLTGYAKNAISTVGQESYAIPAQISKITSTFIQVGQLRFVPVPIQTRVDWDRVNFLPYTSDIVNYAYIYGGQLKFWPVPSTSNNIIQFNYKAKMPDFSFIFQSGNAAWVAGNTPTDYTAGTVTAPAVGATTITGSGTSWSSFFPQNVDVTYFNLYFQVATPNGDAIWYPISKFSSDTSLTLATPVQNSPSTSASSSYTIAQMPLLFDDFHDSLVYGRPMHVYFSSIVENQAKYKQFDDMEKMSLVQMESYLGTKQVNVDLEAEPVLTNPNQYPYAQP